MLHSQPECNLLLVLSKFWCRVPLWNIEMNRFIIKTMQKSSHFYVRMTNTARKYSHFRVRNASMPCSHEEHPCFWWRCPVRMKNIPLFLMAMPCSYEEHPCSWCVDVLFPGCRFIHIFLTNTSVIRKQGTHFVIQMPLVREPPKTLEMLSLLFQYWTWGTTTISGIFLFDKIYFYKYLDKYIIYHTL